MATSSARKKKGKRDPLDFAKSAIQAGQKAAKADRAVEKAQEQERVERRHLPLSSIKPRPEGDAREVKDSHVQELVESIRDLGLLQPVLVDRKYRLIAGAHRLRAYQILQEGEGDRWNDIPVFIAVDLDVEKEPQRALQMEVAENEKRKDFTAKEIQQAASRLMEKGYVAKRGRPAAGEKALHPALAVTFGISTRWVRKLLSEDEATEEALANPQEGPDPVARQKRLKSLKRAIGKASTDPNLEQDEAVLAALLVLKNALDGALSSKRS